VFGVVERVFGLVRLGGVVSNRFGVSGLLISVIPGLGDIVRLAS